MNWCWSVLRADEKTAWIARSGAPVRPARLGPLAPLLIGLAALVGPAFAQPAARQAAPASQPATTRPAAVPVIKQAAAARDWIDKPDQRRSLAAFSPALDLHYREYSKPKAQRLWIARIDLTQPGVRFTCTEPAKFSGADAKFETRCANTLQFAQHTGVQLAFNTSAFGPFRARLGQPMSVSGLAADDGEVYSKAEKGYASMYVARDGRVRLDKPTADEVVWDAFPGFRMLLSDGKLAVTEREANTSFGGVNPRTAVGVDREGKTLWLIVADGRQKGVSVGLTLVELACLFESLDCWDALNLDGGGSSTLVLEDEQGMHEVVNTPVGNRIPGSLRQVAHNAGFYLPGRPGIASRRDEQPADLREALVRLIGGRMGQWQVRPGSAQSPGLLWDVSYGGQVFGRVTSNVCSERGAVLSVLLEACRRAARDPAVRRGEGEWLQGLPLARFSDLWQRWFSPDWPISAEQRLPPPFQVLVDSGLMRPVEDLRDLRRGDLLALPRKDGVCTTAIYWGRDRDEQNRPRLWYWSAHADARVPIGTRTLAGFGWIGKPTSGPAAGLGLNWELLGPELPPEQVAAIAPLSSAEAAAADAPLPTAGASAE